MKARKIKKETTFGDEVLHGLTDFLDSVDRGEPITVRTFKLKLQPTQYKPNDVRRTRKRLCVSQTILARWMGVSAKTVQSWEQGGRPVPGPARRLFDELNVNTDYWKNVLRKMVNERLTRS